MEICMAGILMKDMEKKAIDVIVIMELVGLMISMSQVNRTLRGTGVVHLMTMTIIHLGIVGSVFAKEAHVSDFTDFFSGGLKIFTKHLKQDSDSSRSTGKAHADTLLAQVNNLRQELQLLASSRSVTVVTGSVSGSGNGVTAVVVVVIGVVGYGCIRWKGWKLGDLMFVTRRGFSDVRTMVGKQVDLLSSSVSSARRQLSSKIDIVDNNLNDCLQLTVATKDEVSNLHGELSGIHVDVESVHRAVETLETKLDRIKGSQELTSKGLYILCKIGKRLEQSRNTENIQASISRSTSSLELPQATPVTRTLSLPPLALESSSLETPKTTVCHHSKALSTSAMKELQGISNVIRTSNIRPTTSPAAALEVPNGNTRTQEPSSSSSSSGLFGFLTRRRSTATS